MHPVRSQALVLAQMERMTLRMKMLKMQSTLKVQRRPARCYHSRAAAVWYRHKRRRKEALVVERSGIKKVEVARGTERVCTEMAQIQPVHQNSGRCKESRVAKRCLGFGGKGVEGVVFVFVSTERSGVRSVQTCGRWWRSIRVRFSGYMYW